MQAQPPLWMGLAADGAVTAALAGAFMSIPSEECDPALAEDALGELVNVLMGYIAKDAYADADDYRVTPPEFGRPAAQLAAEPNALAVSMNAEMGTLVLMVAA